MTVTSSTWSASYAGNGVSTSFTVPFRFLDNSHLAVTIVDADGTEHTQVLNTDYTASGAGDATGGVTFSAAPADGTTVIILRSVQVTQEKNYVQGDKFPAESHEQALDKLTMIAQQQGEKLGRTWVSPLGAPGGHIVAGTDGQPAIFNGGKLVGVDPGSSELMIPADHTVNFNKLTEDLVQQAGEGDGSEDDELPTSARVSEMLAAALSADLLADLRKVDPNGPRIPVEYYNNYAVQISNVPTIAMGKWRVRGRYTEARAPVFSMPAFTAPMRHIIDRGDQSGLLIPGGTGTPIGDMTANGGLAAAFDGVTVQAYASSAVEVASGANNDAYLGKTFSTPTIITEARVYPTSDVGFDSTGSASNITVDLYGKQGTAPANSTDGTLLDTISVSDITSSRGLFTDSTTAWDHVWVRLRSDASGARMCLAELEIREYDPQPGDLFCQSETDFENWYAQFAAANADDATATLGSMPYFRVGSIAGNVITLNLAGENDRSVSGKTYFIADNELVGAEVLVISETIDGRKNAESFRIARVTANTATTITLDDVGSMDQFDYFLVAPVKKGAGPYDCFRYLNTCYIDTGGIRNIADDGVNVGSRGADNLQANYSGVLAAPVQIPCDGHISPLASAIKFDHNESVSGSATGKATVRYGHDNSHDVFSNQWRKTSTTSEAWTMAVPPISFAGYYGQSLWLFNAGELNLSGNTRKMQVRGWVEP